MPEAERQRIWEHRQHLNEDLNNLANYFLLAESFLLAAAVALKAERPSITSISLVAVGLGITIVSALVLNKQRFVLNTLKHACDDYFPEYRALRERRLKSGWRLSNTLVLSLIAPLIFGLAWAAIAVDMWIT